MLTIPKGWTEQRGEKNVTLTREDGARVTLAYPTSSKPWVARSDLLGYLDCGAGGGRMRRRVFTTAASAIAAIERAERAVAP